jgi:Right handed beta helix region
MTALLLAVALLLAWVLPAHAANTYHVVASGGGGTACTSVAPCSSIATGVSKLTAGDTLLIHAGTYGEGITTAGMAIPSGTSWSNPVTISAAGDGPVRVAAIDINAYGSTDYKFIIIKGFTLVGIGAFLGGPRLSDIRLEGCDISGAEQDGIQSYDALRVQIVGNHIHNSGQGRLNHGVYMLFPDGLIEGNDFHHLSGYGIQFYMSGTDPCHEPPALAPRRCGTGTIIRNNKVHHNTGDGGVVMGVGDNIQFYNNLVYNNSNGGLKVGYGDINNAQVYNNTFYGNTGSAIQISDVSFASHVTNAQVKNNIIFGNSGQIDNSIGSTSFANNLCGSSGPGCTAVGDPRFVNAGGEDFTLQAASDARNTGTDLGANFNTDFAGAARGQGAGSAWDIGAYEYTEGGGVPATGNPIYLSAGGHADTPSDSGDCTVPENIATPRATLAGALACMTVPGKTLYIRGGTYAGTIWTGGTFAGGSAGAPTRIEGYQAEVALISLPVGQTVGLYVQGRDYVTISKLIVDANARTDSNAFACANADHLTLQQSTFRNSYFESGYFADCPNVTVTQVVFHTAQVAPVVTLDGTMANFTLDQSEIHTGPLQGLNANVNSGSSTSLVVTRTQIHGTGTGAGGFALDLGPSTGAKLENLILDHANAGVRLRTGASGTKVFHSAIAANTGVGLQCDSGATSVTVTNNILFGNGTDVPVNNCGAVLTTNRTTDPLWVNTATRDFHLQSTSLALDAGTALPEVAIAFDGTGRPVGALYDQGPYEAAGTTPPPPPAARKLLWRYTGMFQ